MKGVLSVGGAAALGFVEGKREGAAVACPIVDGRAVDTVFARGGGNGGAVAEAGQDLVLIGSELSKFSVEHGISLSALL